MPACSSRSISSSGASGYEASASWAAPAGAAESFRSARTGEVGANDDALLAVASDHPELSDLSGPVADVSTDADEVAADLAPGDVVGGPERPGVGGHSGSALSAPLLEPLPSSLFARLKFVTACGSGTSEGKLVIA
eukprot:1194205-Prorocentrum_minimum.AAC.2